MGIPAWRGPPRPSSYPGAQSGLCQGLWLWACGPVGLWASVPAKILSALQAHQAHHAPHSLPVCPSLGSSYI